MCHREPGASGGPEMTGYGVVDLKAEAERPGTAKPLAENLIRRPYRVRGAISRLPRGVATRLTLLIK